MAIKVAEDLTRDQAHAGESSLIRALGRESCVNKVIGGPTLIEAFDTTQKAEIGIILCRELCRKLYAEKHRRLVQNYWKEEEATQAIEYFRIVNKLSN